MTLSGFLVSYTKQLDKYGYKGFIVRRTIRLLVPYVVVSLLMLIPKYLIGKLTNTPISLKVTDILYQLVTPREGILPHLWFLLTLWILCMAVPLLRGTMKNKWTTIAMMVIALALIFVPKATNVFAIGDVQIYAFWFCLGLLFGEKQFDLSKAKSVILTLSTIILGGYILICLLWEQNKYAWFLFSMFCLIAVVSISAYAKRPFEKCCSFIGKYSFTIYILSLPIQNIADIFLRRLEIPIVFSYITLFLVGILLPIGIAIIVKVIDRKIGKKCLGTIIGL